MHGEAARVFSVLLLSIGTSEPSTLFVGAIESTNKDTEFVTSKSVDQD